MAVGEAWDLNAWAPNAWAEGAWASGQDIPENLTAATAIIIPALPYATSQNVHSTDTSLTYQVWYRVRPGFNGNVTVSWPTGTIFRPVLSVLTNSGTRVYSGILNRPAPVVSFRAKKNTDFWLRWTPNAGQPTPAILSFAVQRG